MLKRNYAPLYLLTLLLLTAAPLTAQQTVPRWGTFELTLHGPATGNPFVGVSVSAVFTHGDEHYRPEGFYDGDGIYRIRFMPDEEGTWTYETSSNIDSLAGVKGSFTCTAPGPGDHGPVSVQDTYHFGYADSTRFIPFGTTIYEWCFQSDSMRDETIHTLAASPFNKARFLVLPPYSSRYLTGPGKLVHLPFQGSLKDGWDFSRFDPTFFRRLDSCIMRLRDIGVQADVIVFNPYDKGWGFQRMDQLSNKRFMKYVIARFAAYRNVWWSLANENSFIKSMTDHDWDELFQLTEKDDPYHHLRSIHNAGRIYNYTLPWVTHVSLQYYNAARVFGVTPLLRDVYRKPVVYDELNYEGDINRRWGQLTGEEMTYRFWVTYIGGGYATHGEAFVSNGWIAGGGKLIGESPRRIAFLKQILSEAPTLDPIDQYYVLNLAGQPGKYYLMYFGKDKPSDWKFILPKKGLKDGMRFKVDVIDTWNMTIKHLDRVFEIKKMEDGYRFSDKDGASVPLPGKPYMAIRIQAAGS